MNIFMLAQAQDAAGAAGQEPANMFQQILASPMFMFVIIIVLFWVMLIRPQRKAQKEQQARIAAPAARGQGGHKRRAARFCGKGE